jgi:hypothetical protein
MPESVLVAVDVPQVGDARHKHWAKVVTGVDTSKSSGWAFTGDFIADGGIQDVPLGSVLLVFGERGARTNPQSEAHVYTVNPDATLTHHASSKGRAWARTLRDPITDLLSAGLPQSPDLSGYPDEVLVDELRRRGWEVNRPSAVG